MLIQDAIQKTALLTLGGQGGTPLRTVGFDRSVADVKPISELIGLETHYFLFLNFSYTFIGGSSYESIHR